MQPSEGCKQVLYNDWPASHKGSEIENEIASNASFLYPPGSGILSVQRAALDFSRELFQDRRCRSGDVEEPNALGLFENVFFSILWR